ncbi:MAG TPA: hypothetical protein VLL48_05370, partial [Longimicrobiales bacterium]|nr:hypothetical protein [Longimicrobiales bacterium]
MRHLTNEDLARLVDEAPTPEERRHLAACRRCVAELDGLREQTEALSALPDLRLPADEWRELERRLAREGLVKERSPARASPPTGGRG